MKQVIHKLKGEVTMFSVIVGAVASIIAAGITAYGVQSATASAQIEKQRQDTSAIVERVAKLEEAVSTIKTDNAEIKGDIKELLRRTK